jgi:hypothetical protein
MESANVKGCAGQESTVFGDGLGAAVCWQKFLWVVVIQNCRTVSRPFSMRMVENLGPTCQRTVRRQKYRAHATPGLREKETTGLLSMDPVRDVIGEVRAAVAVGMIGFGPVGWRR